MPHSSCALCGVPVSERLSRSWTPYFRAVYRRNDTWGPAGTQLSGVGLRDHGLDKAPLARSAHFYDNNFEPHDLCVFRLVRRHNDEPALLPLQDGYPFHLACWNLLELVAGTDPISEAGPHTINLNHLHQFLNCFPEQHGRINWGHHHGVFEYEQSACNFTGFEHVFKNEPRGWSGYHQDPGDSYAIQAALRFPKRSREILPLPVRSGTRSFSCTSQAQAQGDAFSRIPIEIRDMILFQLSSPDVLSLKLASRSFAEVRLSDAFWGSRFNIGQEMEHIYEAHDSTVRLGNWRDTYFEMVVQENRYDTLRNRARIMGIAHVLLNILRRMGESSAALVRGVECGMPGPSRMFDVWSAGAVVAKPRVWSDMPTADFDYGAQVDPARVRYLRGISRGAQIWVSFITLPDARYISGLRFEDEAASTSSCIGYLHEDNEELLPFVAHSKGRQGSATLSGFEFAVGSRGVLGIRRLGGAGGSQTGPWVGTYIDVPRKLLPLCSIGKDDDTYMLTCGFDAIKLVTAWALQRTNTASLPQASSTTEVLTARESRNIREHSVWHPEIPPARCTLSPLAPFREIDYQDPNEPPHDALSALRRRLDQNDASGAIGVTYPYETMFFGGEDGGLLARVTGMTVSLREGAVVELGFSLVQDCERGHGQDGDGDGVAESSEMANPQVPNDKDKLLSPTTADRIRTMSLPAATSTPQATSGGGAPRHGGLHDDVVLGHNQRTRGFGVKKTLEFAIDGPAGERIVGIDVIGVSYGDKGQGEGHGRDENGGETAVGALQIHTNFGRTFLTQDDSVVSSANLEDRPAAVLGHDEPTSTVLVGLYAQRNHYGRFISLGSITVSSVTSSSSGPTGRVSITNAAERQSRNKGEDHAARRASTSESGNTDCFQAVTCPVGMLDLEDEFKTLALGGDGL